MPRDVFALVRRHRGAVLVVASWLVALRLLALTVPHAQPHSRFLIEPIALRLALWLGVPFLAGVVVPRSWRRDLSVLTLVLVVVFWLSTAPWNGTADTPAGWHWTFESFAVAVIDVTVQYLAFVAGIACSRLRARSANGASV